MRKRSDARSVDGILLFDKPRGLSSNTALQRVKRLYRAERAGHTGTLDPLATGLLPVCLGEATKFGGSLLDSDKGYLATVKLGERTDTGDATGAVLERADVNIDRARLEAALACFRGTIDQVPPMYSALKREGRPLYELARQGKSVERQPRTVQVLELELIEFASPQFIIKVTCSKGTYIRTLAEDVGSVLACGAHIQELRRTSVGIFDLDQSCSLDALEGMSEEERDRRLLPVDSLVRSWSRIDLSAAEAARFRHGGTVQRERPDSGSEPFKSAVYDDAGIFVGLGSLDASGLLRPQRLLRTGQNAGADGSERP